MTFCQAAALSAITLSSVTCPCLTPHVLIKSATYSQPNLYENISVCPRRKSRQIQKCPVYANLQTVRSHKTSRQLSDKWADVNVMQRVMWVCSFHLQQLSTCPLLFSDEYEHEQKQTCSDERWSWLFEFFSKMQGSLWRWLIFILWSEMRWQAGVHVRLQEAVRVKPRSH